MAPDLRNTTVCPAVSFCQEFIDMHAEMRQETRDYFEEIKLDFFSWRMEETTLAQEKTNSKTLTLDSKTELESYLRTHIAMIHTNNKKLYDAFVINILPLFDVHKNFSRKLELKI